MDRTDDLPDGAELDSALSDGAPSEPLARATRLARRQRWFLAVAVAAALVSTAGLAASTLIKSPAEQAAEAKPPKQSLITAVASMQTLDPAIVLRGTVYPGVQYNVSVAAASADVTQLYVSRLAVKVGDALHSGELLAEVSGQPLFTLRGSVPAYRDMKPGDNGPDVAELQSALAGAGYSSAPDAAGTFGRGTGRAVTAYYRHLGYQAPTTGAATQQAVDTADKAVQQDQSALAALLAPAGSPAGAPTGSTATAAPATGASHSQQLTAARTQLANDQAALSAARNANGVMVPSAEVVFLPYFPSVVRAVNAGVGQPVSGPLLGLTTGQLALTGQLSPQQAASVKPGMKVQILDETHNLSATGTVADLLPQTSTPVTGKVIGIGGGAGAGAGAAGAGGAAAGGTGGSSGGGGTSGGAGADGSAFVPMEVTPSVPLPASFNGENVRLTVLTSSSAAPVLSVPVAAVFTTAAGQTSVTRVGAGGSRTTVPVSTGASANGLVGVTPLGGAELVSGDTVAVGQ